MQTDSINLTDLVFRGQGSVSSSCRYWPKKSEACAQLFHRMSSSGVPSQSEKSTSNNYI